MLSRRGTASIECVLADRKQLKDHCGLVYNEYFDSFLEDDSVFIFQAEPYADEDEYQLETIDYFHGWVLGDAQAQMDSGIDLSVTEMFRSVWKVFWIRMVAFKCGLVGSVT